MALPDSPRPHPLDMLRAGALARLLTVRLEDLVAAVLLPDLVRIHGAVRGRDPAGGEWIVRLDGNKRGLCLCSTTPIHSGDPLVFVAWARCGGDRVTALAWSRAFLRHLLADRRGSARDFRAAA